MVQVRTKWCVIVTLYPMTSDNIGPIQKCLKNIPYFSITLLDKGLHCTESILYTLFFEIDKSKIIVIYKKNYIYMNEK